MKSCGKMTAIQIFWQQNILLSLNLFCQIWDCGLVVSRQLQFCCVLCIEIMVYNVNSEQRPHHSTSYSHVIWIVFGCVLVGFRNWFSLQYKIKNHYVGFGIFQIGFGFLYVSNLFAWIRIRVWIRIQIFISEYLKIIDSDLDLQI